MKKLLLVFVIFNSTGLLAQQIKVNYSAKFEFRKEEGTEYQIGNFYYRMDLDLTGPQFAIGAKLSKNVHAITLYKYDAAMKEIKAVKLEEGKKNFGPFNSHFVILDNKLLLVYYKYPDAKTIKLFVSEVNQETLSLDNTKEALSLPVADFGFLKALSMSSSDNQLYTSVSPDKTKLLLLHSNTSQIGSCIVDKELNITGVSTAKSPDEKGFLAQFVCVDNAGNKYMSYRYTENRLYRRGIYMQNTAGKQSFQRFNTGKSEFYANDIKFKCAGDNSKVWLYANFYGEYLNEGVVLATADVSTLTIKISGLYPYPEDYRQRLHKLDFGYRKKGIYSVEKADFTMLELDNGSIALVGEPELEVTGTSSKGGSISRYFSGPIMAVVIKEGKPVFSLVPRKVSRFGGSPVLPVAYKNNIVCIYNDDKKNIEKSEDENKVSMEVKVENMALAAVVISSDGSVISKKRIADDPDGRNFFFLSDMQKISDTHFVIPVGHIKTKMTKYLTEIVQWATVKIE